MDRIPIGCEQKVAYEALLKTLWKMRRGNDVGTQYRSGIYVHDTEQRAAAWESLAAYQERLTGQNQQVRAMLESRLPAERRT